METNGELSYVPERNEQPDEKSTCGKWLQAMQNCINKEIVFKGIKILGFIALLILVTSKYGLDIWTKFQNNTPLNKRLGGNLDILSEPKNPHRSNSI